MKKGQCYEGIVETVKFPAKGIVAVENEDTRVVVKRVIPGQRISFRVTKKRSGKAEGMLLEVLTKAPNEIEAPCPHFGKCGGCNYLNLSYADQLALKSGQVQELLDEVYIKCGKEPDYEFQGIKESPRQFAYRNKMEFSFGDEYKNGPLALGLHKSNSFYDIVTVEDCQIVDADYRLILKTVLDYFIGEGTSFYHRMRQEGYLRHLLVRKAVKTGEILIALVTGRIYSNMPLETPEKATATTDTASKPGSTDATDTASKPGSTDAADTASKPGSTDAADTASKREAADTAPEEKAADTAGAKEKRVLAGFQEALLQLERDGRLTGRIAGILHTTNESVADVIRADDNEILYGKDYFYEELLGLRFRISQFSFFQTNSLGAEILYETVREYIGEPSEADRGQVVFDLYSGTGTIAQMMAPVSKKVIGVEIVEEAVEAARENAKLNGLHNCEFIAGDVLRVLDDIAERPDLIILDPPRDGVHPKALAKIIAYGVERMVYISCKPTSLARDLETFFANGYRMKKACAVDMFPGTGNVETVCLLSKLHSSQHIDIDLDMSELDLTAAESKATYEEIKEYILEKHGMKVSSLYIAQIKHKYGLDVGKNYNLSKKENAKVPQCPPEKEKVIKEALEHFQMI